MSPNAWNGQERRTENRDHDTLIEMVQILRSHVANFDTLNKRFEEHQNKDESNFNDLKKANLKIEKIIWMASGAIISVQAIPAVVKIIHLFK